MNARAEPIDLRPELPRRLMRRAAAVAASMSGLVLMVGLFEAGDRIDEEVRAAMVQAGWVEHLSALRYLPDTEAMATLEVLRLHLPLRHLNAEVRDENGRLLMGVPGKPAGDGAMGVLAGWHARIWPQADPVPLTWHIVRPGDRHWTVRMSASPDGERREVINDLLLLSGVSLAGLAVLLLLMHGQVRQTLRPMRQLLEAIGRLRHDDRSTVHALPAMPLPELQLLATSLKELAVALDRAQDDRRMLAQQVQSLQEDERSRLARELHDELGQHLTALRADLAWLQRTAGQDGAAREVAQSAAERADRIQHELRAVLQRLRPLDDREGASPAGGMAQLLRRLEQLVQAWQTPAMGSLQVRLELAVGPPGAARPSDAETLTGLMPHLPQPLALALHRISQEGLTNVARHAHADEVVLSLSLDPPRAQRPAELLWSLCDDGVGIADWSGALQRGSGLAGLRERIWALGGELTQQPARPGHSAPGLRLSARFSLVPRVPPATSDGPTDASAAPGSTPAA